MKVCTFFGHRNCSETIKPAIKSAIENLIINENVNTFYVGKNGLFDFYAYKVLKELKLVFNEINIFVVLAYIPTSKDSTLYYDTSETIYPDGLEKSPRRFCIDKRNLWMIKKSDFVITHIRHTFGGAYKHALLAKSKGKRVFNVL